MKNVRKDSILFTTSHGVVEIKVLRFNHLKRVELEYHLPRTMDSAAFLKFKETHKKQIDNFKNRYIAKQ